MVGSLLRTKNYCIDYEAEKDLNQQMMYEELLILYERRNMYRKCKGHEHTCARGRLLNKISSQNFFKIIPIKNILYMFP